MWLKTPQEGSEKMLGQGRLRRESSTFPWLPNCSNIFGCPEHCVGRQTKTKLTKRCVWGYPLPFGDWFPEVPRLF